MDCSSQRRAQQAGSAFKDQDDSAQEKQGRIGITIARKLTRRATANTTLQNMPGI